MILRLWRLEYPKYCAADLGFKALHLRFGENLAIELIGVLNVGLVSLSIDPCTEEPICDINSSIYVWTIVLHTAFSNILQVLDI